MVQSHVVRGEAAGIDIVVAALVLEYQLDEALLVPRAEHDEGQVFHRHALGESQVVNTRLSLAQCAERVLVAAVEAVKNRFSH